MSLSGDGLSTSPSRIALVGDFNVEIVAHRAINKCFCLVADAGSEAEAEWVATDRIVPGDETAFGPYAGIWCVPGSPYANTNGALWAIQYARTRSVPFLGTCGGYQHALLEYARHELGLGNSGHTERDPATSLPLLDRMHCPLIEQSQKILITNEQFRVTYGGDSGLEGFHCSYGLNSAYERLFAGTALEIVARSEDGQARAFQLRGHPFFVGTHFQPERKALTGSAHPLVQAFFAAVTKPAMSHG